METTTLNFNNYARQLPTSQRAELVHGLRTSPLAHEHEVESAWMSVAAGRLEAYNRGEVKAQPIDKLLVKLKALL